MSARLHTVSNDTRPAVEVHGLGKTYPGGVQAVRGIGLDIAQGLERVWLPIAILPAPARKAEGRKLIENPRQEFHHEGRAHSQERADLNQ